MALAAQSDVEKSDVEKHLELELPIVYWKQKLVELIKIMKLNYNVIYFQQPTKVFLS